MPIINITLIEGYEAAARERLSQRVTDATVSVIKAPADLVTVIVSEVETTNYMRGGITRTPGSAQPVASAIVKAFLSAMENRDVGTAEAFLSDEFHMIFPGGERFRRLQELFEWAKMRYQLVGKSYEKFDECYAEGESIVYCYGTLQGIWLDGTEFSGIRFVDRFAVVDGLIVSQQVWNDLAEASNLP